MSTSAIVNALLVKLTRDAEYVVRDLEAIRSHLDEDGDALSAVQLEALSQAIVPIGIAGADLLGEDRPEQLEHGA